MREARVSEFAVTFRVGFIRRRARPSENGDRIGLREAWKAQGKHPNDTGEFREG